MAGDDKGRFHVTDRPVLHHMEHPNRNSDHIGIEMASAKLADDRTPAEVWFRQVDLDLDALDSALNTLFQKLQPALSPGFHGDDVEDCMKADQQNSSFVEQLKVISRRINAFEESANIVAKRVEL